MTITTTYKPMTENQRVYDLIWSQMPHMQKPTSSSWWFFILFPKEAEGYGPRQMMFSIASRVGETISINGSMLPGIDLKRKIVDGVDIFDAIATGWYCDGEQVYDEFVEQTAVTTLSEHDGFIKCWADKSDGTQHGYEISRSINRPLALTAKIRGAKGTAEFEAWGDLDSLDSSPHESLNINTPLGGTHFIAWRRMNFEGVFDLPTGQEELAGICYFQRVCLNVPTFPWKWIWSLFPDGSMFSAYIPYVGRNLLRKGYQFFASNQKEQAIIPIAANGFWDWPGPSERVIFKKAGITPILGNGPHPQFMVQMSNKQGDHLSFLAAPYGHANMCIDRPVLNGRFESHWNYNEYMFRMQQLNGRVSGKHITKATMGQAFGSLEYTWGLGL